MSSPVLWLIVLGGCTLVAAADEYHQSFVPTRGSSPVDVMIDSGGAMAGLVARSLVSVIRKRRDEPGKRKNRKF